MNPETKPLSTCYGITNRTKDGLFVLFADYDQVNFGVMVKELDNLIARFPNQFTNFLILETSESFRDKQGNTIGSYHVINFSKMPFQVMRERLSYLSVDEKFFKLPKNTSYRCNTLRVSPKFAWEEQQDQEGKGVGLKQVLKDSPRFVCWYPTTEMLTTKREVSTAHLTAYFRLIKGIPFRTWGKKEDLLGWVELKKYDSLGA